RTYSLTKTNTPLATAMLCVVVAAPPSAGAEAEAATGRRSNCTTHCGNISIPYPFGVEPGCYHESGFNLTCNQSYSPPQLFLGDGTVQVLDIDLPNGTVRINSKPLEILYGDNGKVSRRTWRAGGLGYAADGPYFVAGAGRNNLVALGCNVQAILLGEDNTLVSSCYPFCPTTGGYMDTDTCSGIGCCQATILEGRASYGLQVQRVGFVYYRSWVNVLIVESDYLLNSTEYYYNNADTAPAMLTWAINSSICHTNGLSPACRSVLVVTKDGDHVDRWHNCKCTGGYQGNPYISHGCYGLGIGLVASGSSIILLLVLAAPFIARKMKLNRANKLKRRLFKQNHGLLLQQLISQKTDFGERMIIPLLDLEKATNNFDRTREAGGGGHGVVYKGILDLQVVAIKKSKIIVQREIAASMPIYHRDIKSSNILLDGNLTAKVSDFGASRYTPIDKTGVTTVVQGTIGYLDPMYYYTGRLTDKSDVFSFGVLLVELLARKKPCLYRSGGDGVGLVSHFVSLLTDGNLDELIDPQVMEEGDGDVQEVAMLAAMCIKLKGEDRPTMREVEMKLENMRVNMCVAPDTAASRRYGRGQTESLYMPIEAVVVEASRQYTMEEEILASASYPR
uniref:Protein kinase domain-containing protein n=1 Tax=Aegilops tauschii subsp. strangulata TaxID=200361 RepID=A0A453PX44_AEGTS